MSTFTGAYAACILYPAPRRDALLRLAVQDLSIYYQIDLAPAVCSEALLQQRPALRNSPFTTGEFLASLQKQHPPQAVTRLREIEHVFKGEHRLRHVFANVQNLRIDAFTCSL